MTDDDNYDLAVGPRVGRGKCRHVVPCPEHQRQTWRERACKEIVNQMRAGRWRRAYRAYLVKGNAPQSPHK